MLKTLHTNERNQMSRTKFIVHPGRHLMVIRQYWQWFRARILMATISGRAGRNFPSSGASSGRLKVFLAAICKKVRTTGRNSLKTLAHHATRICAHHVRGIAEISSGRPNFPETLQPLNLRPDKFVRLRPGFVRKTAHRSTRGTSGKVHHVGSQIRN
jgi:hypothetical protein